MNALAHKLHLLEQSAPNPETLSAILDKLLANQADQYRQKIAHYDASILGFEKKFGLSSQVFIQQFNEGLLGDDMDYFEWEGLLKLKELAQSKLDLMEKSGV
jgi:hypothetical protein